MIRIAADTSEQIILSSLSQSTNLSKISIILPESEIIHSDFDYRVFILEESTLQSSLTRKTLIRENRGEENLRNSN